MLNSVNRIASGKKPASRRLFILAALGALAAAGSAMAVGPGDGPYGPVEGEISGAVSAVRQSLFEFEAPNGVLMHVHVDANTRFMVGQKVTATPHIVVGTYVTIVAGNSAAVGQVDAIVLRVTPSKDQLTGTVIAMDKKESSFTIQQGDDKAKLKVFVIKETKVKYVDNAKLKIGSKVTVGPITNHADKVEAWTLTVSEGESSSTK